MEHSIEPPFGSPPPRSGSLFSATAPTIMLVILTIVFGLFKCEKVEFEIKKWI